ncbi:hypothetical protein [Nonomuraea basaltis]|uniref:hypothetical protein n=1 Tax=Nonomuraea basaltis TaxID=2495887 RepID=UPI00110C5375|nr:hypothetical protein [Nonomuraea basaltis]TMR90527.1 hypothetical protein EJK15_54780 [Nonomuraea basaltis]
MPATGTSQPGTSQLSPEIALITRYRRREGRPEPELLFKPLARRISRASGVRFGEQRWRRRESGEVRDVSDTDLAWMAWAVDVPADELADTGRTDAADLLRQIRAEQAEQAEAAQVPAEPGDDDDLEIFFQQAVSEINSLRATPEEKKRMRAFLRQQIQQARNAVEMFHPR